MAYDTVCGALLAALLFVSFLPFSGSVWDGGKLLGWLMLLAATLGDREGAVVRRAVITAGLFGVWVGGVVLLCALAGDISGASRLFQWFWKYEVWPQLLLAAWMASWFFDPQSSPGIDRGVRALVALIVLFVFWQAIALAASLNNPRSIKTFGLDTGTYLCAMLLVTRLWVRRRGGLNIAYRVVVIAAAVQIFAALAMGLAAATADELTRQALAAPPGEFILIIPGHSWRLRFPLTVHNRLGVAMLLNVFILALAWIALRGRRIAVVLPGLIAGAFVAAVLSMTRGAMVAIVLGFVPLIVVRRRLRWPLALAIALPAVMFLASAPHRTLVASIFDPVTWTSRDTSIGHRIDGWRAAIMMMEDHPGTGVGYDMKSFRVQYRKKYRALTGGREDIVHSHNTFLEYGAESGIPALVIFIALMGFRWWALGRALLRRPGDATLLLLAGYELAMFVFIQFFFMHKRTQGILLWAFWIWATLYCLDAARRANNQIASEEVV